MAGSKRKKKPEENPPGAPGWMITYGDMMSLLLCFFVLLFSFSTLDVVRFREVIVELQGALGVLSGGPMVLNMGDVPQQAIIPAQAVEVKSQISEFKEKIDEKAEEEQMQDSVETVIDQRGLRIRFTDKALFDLGKAEIKPAAFPILRVVGDEIASMSNPVLIEGHTDDWPINTPQFPSNWELSTARATAIIHYFIEEIGIDPTRLSAAGYSMYHPVVPNTTPENKAMNRRVDIIILLGEDDKAALRREDRANTLMGLESPGAYNGVIMNEGE
jgi:chemotaxis protein MotB